MKDRLVLLTVRGNRGQTGISLLGRGYARSDNVSGRAAGSTVGRVDRCGDRKLQPYLSPQSISYTFANCYKSSWSLDGGIGISHALCKSTSSHQG
jgi:hypothetical protein